MIYIFSIFDRNLVQNDLLGMKRVHHLEYSIPVGM
jgi:hypothetical protein